MVAINFKFVLPTLLRLIRPSKFTSPNLGRISHIASNYYPMRDSKFKNPFTVCVEGNIGCGKTTLLNYFAQFNDVDVLHEPVHKWMNLNNFNLLDLMYKDPHRWSHLFQTYVQLTMMEQHIKPCSAPTKIMERSLFSARFCFVENLYQSGRMSEVEYKVYCEWYNMITNIIDCKVDLIVYLRTDPSILNRRIIGRARNEEAGIPMEYLESLHQLHEKWLVEKAFQNTVPVLVIDANGSIDEMKSLYQKHLGDIVQKGRRDSFSSSPVKILKPLAESSNTTDNGSSEKESPKKLFSTSS